MTDPICAECGAPLIGVSRCREYLDQMITWDFEDFTGVGQVHHLTVGAYNLQHPSVFSRKGLENAKRALVDFVKDPRAYAKHGAYDRSALGSDVRDWKITGTPDDHGVYATPPQWRMRASDVARGGLGEYVANVLKWSNSVLEDLRESGNL